jgi:hypothetical protein
MPEVGPESATSGREPSGRNDSPRSVGDPGTEYDEKTPTGRCPCSRRSERRDVNHQPDKAVLLGWLRERHMLGFIIFSE